MIYRLRVYKSRWAYTRLANFHRFELGKRVVYLPHWTFEYLVSWASPNTWQGRVLSIFERSTDTRVRHIIKA
jgi:hypothetical protein